MAAGKWIPDLTPETPTVDAARRALSLRFEALREALGTALQAVDDDLENIHQLRVACRRASAAVDLFRNCLPGRASREAKQTLRTYRRVAGEARDWDVLMLSLAERLKTTTNGELPGIDLLFGYTLAQRIPAQERLEALCPGYPFQYERWMTGILAALQTGSDAPATVAELAREMLSPRFDAFWRQVQQPDMTWTELHDARISAKRLRYSLEVVGDAFPGTMFETVYRRLSEVQSILGDSNDGFVGNLRMEMLQQRLPQLFRQTWPRWSPLIEQLHEEHRQAMHDARDRFETWKQKAERDQFDAMVRTLFQPASPISPLEPVRQEAG